VGVDSRGDSYAGLTVDTSADKFARVAASPIRESPRLESHHHMTTQPVTYGLPR